jgi:hypothetical protein
MANQFCLRVDVISNSKRIFLFSYHTMSCLVNRLTKCLTGYIREPPTISHAGIDHSNATLEEAMHILSLVRTPMLLMVFQIPRLVLLDTPLYTLQLLTWRPNERSPIHRHYPSECLLRVMEGSVGETRFLVSPKTTTESLRRVEKQHRTLRQNDIVYISDIIGPHHISNLDSHRIARTLHLYIHAPVAKATIK